VNGTNELSEFINDIFFVAPKFNSGLGHLIVEVSRSHTTHTHTNTNTHTQAIGITKRPLPTQHTTNTKDEHECPHGDSNPRSQNFKQLQPFRIDEVRIAE